MRVHLDFDLLPAPSHGYHAGPYDPDRASAGQPTTPERWVRRSSTS